LGGVKGHKASTKEQRKIVPTMLGKGHGMGGGAQCLIPKTVSVRINKALTKNLLKKNPTQLEREILVGDIV